ncbi:MAG: heavy metal translocating P-type ATPase metal-binding domain-containing protein [Bacteroidetes bacterium]|jgi:Cu+-exporting ATPase|nr:heavy metal translocating P-type ATPase metal-binding domain-containing protein [Bacteroidota bacterium]
MAGQACIHCGADCGKSPVIWDNKAFCCHGCKTVYQILHEKEMGEYYQIQPMSGIRVETESSSNKFAFLDNEEIKAQLLDFTDGTISKVKFFVPSIHCASCIWLLEHLDTLNPAVNYSAVNFPRKEVYITFRNDQVSLRQLAEMLAAIHYVPEITLDQLEKKGSSKTGRNLLVKIGIAAFSFLNIMMYSFPEYLPGGDLLEQDFKDVFGWLSFLLILPVVFYSASDYFLTAYKGLRHKLISIDIPITLGILALFFQSSYAVFSGHGIGYMDSLAGLVFFLLIGKWYQGKTYEALSFERDYKSYFPVAITRLLNGVEEIVQIKTLKKGDLILVRNQELVPTDSRLVKGKGNIDYAFVTGESVPVPKQNDDFIYAGGRQVGSSIELEVVKEVEQSYLTQLWNQKETSTRVNTLDNHINKISQYFTIAVLVIAFSAFGYWLSVSLETAVFVFTSVLIIACPCALALTIPFTFGNTMRVFGRKGFYIKKTDVIEQLHKTTTIVFDKTGTLTLSRQMSVEFKGDEISKDELAMIRSMVRHSSHPLSAALYHKLESAAGFEPDSYEEIPGLGITGLIGKTRINVGSKQFVTGSGEADSSKESRVYVSIAGEQIGYFSIKNVYREGLQSVIKDLGTKYDLHLLSGDNEAERDHLQQVFGPQARLHFNQSPTDKKTYVENLRKAGKHVLMIGDGLNDAGALASSDTGISIADDVFSFSPACDAILESTKFDQLNSFIGFTRTSFLVVRISFVISFLYNLIGLSFAVSALLSPLIAAILMPVSSVSVVIFATVATRWLAARKLK